MKKLLTETLRLLPIAIISFILHLLIVLYNVNAIPVGDEIGAIVEAFLMLIFGSFFYLLSVIGAFIFSKQNINNKTTFQIIFFLICLALTYLSTYYVFLHRPPAKTQEELTKDQRNDLPQLKKRALKILEDDENIPMYNQTRSIDSIKIINYFQDFLINKPKITNVMKDSIYGLTFHSLFDRNLDSDYTEVERYTNRIGKTMKLNYLSYSNDGIFVFMILTYEIEESKRANSLIMIGQKKSNTLILNKYECFRNDYSDINTDYSLYTSIIDVTEEEKTCFKKNPFKKYFWNCDYFQKSDYMNKTYFKYQLIPAYHAPEIEFYGVKPEIII